MSLRLVSATSGVIFFFLFLRAREEAVLEENQVESAHRDAAVGEIEDRCEKQKAATSHERNPRRPDRVNQRKVEHVHDTTEHQRGVIEDHTVEKAVYDVAECAGGDQREAHKDSCRDYRFAVRQQSLTAVTGHGLAHKRGYPPAESTRERDSEERQQKLAHSPAELHSESHSFILDEEDLEPVSDDAEMLTYLHIRLDQNLDDLVNDDKYDSQNQEALTFGNLH